MIDSLEVVEPSRALPLPPPPPSSGLKDALASADSLMSLTQMFTRISGRQLSADGIASIMFLRQHGSADIVEDLMKDKAYMTDPKELREMVREASAATATRDLMEHQSKLSAGRTG